MVLKPKNYYFYIVHSLRGIFYARNNIFLQRKYFYSKYLSLTLIETHKIFLQKVSFRVVHMRFRIR